MEQHRFFISPDAIEGDIATITGEDVAHIARVLRLRPGDEICLCDGQGMEYAARICAEQERQQPQLRAEIFARRACDSEPTHRVVLYQGIPKAGKMETILQKCVELGVHAVQPVWTMRCVAASTGGKDEKKLARYRRVAYEAAKQSRRGIVPEVLAPKQLRDCDFSAYDRVLLAYEGEQQRTLKQALRGQALREQALRQTQGDSIALIVGPEGGFAPEEVEALRRMGALPVTLGRRILRTETAGMAMLAMTMYELESE